MRSRQIPRIIPELVIVVNLKRMAEEPGDLVVHSGISVIRVLGVDTKSRRL